MRLLLGGLTSVCCDLTHTHTHTHTQAHTHTYTHTHTHTHTRTHPDPQMSQFHKMHQETLLLSISSLCLCQWKLLLEVGPKSTPGKRKPNSGFANFWIRKKKKNVCHAVPEWASVMPLEGQCCVVTRLLVCVWQRVWQRVCELVCDGKIWCECQTHTHTHTHTHTQTYAQRRTRIKL